MTFQVIQELASGERPPSEQRSESSSFQLVVEEGPATADGLRPILESVHAVLVAANRLQQLPDDYLDVTEGWFARGKRWLKRKLLNNFRRAYVDVLSRQQSAFNRQTLTALNELAECCAALDHAGQQRRAESGEHTAESAERPSPSDLRIALSALRSSLEGLEARVEQLEEADRMAMTNSQTV